MVTQPILAAEAIAITALEARAKINRIKGHWQAFWFELKDFHECQDWLPLGYTSFKACIEQELGISERRAYQLLDAARIRQELDTEHVFSIDRATEGQLRELKPLEPEQRIEVARQIDFANTPVREVREIVQQAKTGNMAVHFSSETDEWYTPPEIIERVQRVFAIDLDPCSDQGRNVPAKRHFTRIDDGLSRMWAGSVYMNPPYGRAIADWVAKLADEYAAGNVSEAIALVPARTDTEWFARLRDCAICFINGRLRFSGMENSAPFPSAVIYFGDKIPAFEAAFSGIGDVWVRLGRDKKAIKGRL